MLPVPHTVCEGAEYSVSLPTSSATEWEAAAICWRETRTDRKTERLGRGSWHEAGLFWLWCYRCCLGCSLRGCNHLALKEYNGQPTTPTLQHCNNTLAHLVFLCICIVVQLCLCWNRTGEIAEKQHQRWERWEKEESRETGVQPSTRQTWRTHEKKSLCGNGSTACGELGTHWMRIGHKVDWDEIHPSLSAIIRQHCDPGVAAMDVCVPADVKPIWDLLLLYPWEMCLV